MEQAKPTSTDLDALQNEFAQRYGLDATYTYFHEGSAYTMTLSDAIDICGKHIADTGVDMVRGMLESMREKAAQLELLSGERYMQSKQRGSIKSAIAQRAMRSKG